MSSVSDFYHPAASEELSRRFSVPLDGSKISLGPFPFRPRSIVLINQTASNMLVQDDRGEQYVAAQSIGATYGVGDSIRYQAWLDVARSSGKATVVVSDQPAGISAAQLSSFAAVGAAGAFKRLALGSFPPAGPLDGDTYALVIATGVVWVVMFNAATAFWDVLGGNPIFAEVVTSESTASTTYVALATAGPSIVLPRPGDYSIEQGFRRVSDSDANHALMSYDIGGVAAVDADASWEGGTSSGNTAASVARVRQKTGLAAVTLTSKYRKTAAVASAFTERWMRVMPSRIQ